MYDDGRTSCTIEVAIFADTVADSRGSSTEEAVQRRWNKVAVFPRYITRPLDCAFHFSRSQRMGEGGGELFLT